ncbi:LacI family DNA-binding transcriptional regulator [Amycolatopsis sp. YIM 10]|uniref:LacI family DNA-binding transcriptional regulator n=1 Tax=Amycolatopsis sp. YIM 10 TaxID=2653857 RepID=UPI00128FF807|nr:LacI family DNA-binding transcriptional regulator [Amycolatopsis sp. YIM 10]QFU89352.1 HTH-type transcriptional repressor CytR [Amycolatopsis sp. YIM 10]
MATTKRPTIADIAKAAGVSTGAVSYALNNRRGVSEATRRRVHEIAATLGWLPNAAARVLSGGPAGAIGLVVDRPARVLGIEPYFMQLISGIQAALAGGPTSLLLQVTDNAEAQLAIYRRWWAERRVDGILLVDLLVDDPRVQLVRDLGLPAVVLGEPQAELGLPYVWTDDEKAMTFVVDYLATLGHREIARVAGPPEFVHTRRRSAAFLAATTGLPGARVITAADYSGDAAARITRRLLTGRTPPTALVFDNDVMAVAALGVARELGLDVPGRLSVVAWDDSALCRLVRPALTAVRRPTAERGAAAVNLLLRSPDTGPAWLKTEDPELRVRSSTGPAG